MVGDWLGGGDSKEAWHREAKTRKGGRVRVCKILEHHTSGLLGTAAREDGQRAPTSRVPEGCFGCPEPPKPSFSII